MRYAARRSRPIRAVTGRRQKAANEAASGDAGGERRRRATITGRQQAALVLFFLAFAVMIYGVIPWEDLGIGLPTLWWWFPEMTASFLLFAILIGVVARMSEADFTGDVRRWRPGPARRGADHRHRPRDHGDHEQRADHRHGAQRGRAGGGRPGRRGVHQPDVRLFLPLSFLIPSSSGLATVAMPIMAPLASFADVRRSSS